MSLVFQIIVSAFLCLILFALVWMAKSKVFLPIKGGEDVRISTVVFARGRAESLQPVSYTHLSHSRAPTSGRIPGFIRLPTSAALSRKKSAYTTTGKPLWRITRLLN